MLSEQLSLAHLLALHGSPQHHRHQLQHQNHHPLNHSSNANTLATSQSDYQPTSPRLKKHPNHPTQTTLSPPSNSFFEEATSVPPHPASSPSSPQLLVFSQRFKPSSTLNYTPSHAPVSPSPLSSPPPSITAQVVTNSSAPNCTNSTTANHPNSSSAQPTKKRSQNSSLPKSSPIDNFPYAYTRSHASSEMSQDRVWDCYAPRSF